MKIASSFLIFAALAGICYGQNKSVYTSTNTKDCRTIVSSSKEGGSYEGACPGVGGYTLHVIEGDLRQTLNVITPAKKKFELNLWTIFSGFSSVGDKVEWRVAKGVPIALIARYIVADASNSSKNTSYLMISKIGGKISCVTDVVEPGPKQNEKARLLADKAAKKACKSSD
jgi:hypothetical protein